uniref:SKP1 component POZ domain-containing protein n=1 Tax=Brassica campestris TaxID=3711 RepID=A0A3P5Y8Z5_BRACM|nr:unnamed protein product [Brassica rapa]
MKKTVRLRSCRGKIYEIDEVVASQSKLIANYCEGGDILIEDVKDEILDLVIDYCKNHARASSSSSSSEMDLKSSGFTPDEKEAVWIRNAWAEANDEDDDDDVLFDVPVAYV